MHFSVKIIPSISAIYMAWMVFGQSGFRLKIFVDNHELLC